MVQTCLNQTSKILFQSNIKQCLNHLATMFDDVWKAKNVWWEVWSGSKTFYKYFMIEHVWTVWPLSSNIEHQTLMFSGDSNTNSRTFNFCLKSMFEDVWRCGQTTFKQCLKVAPINSACLIKHVWTVCPLSTWSIFSTTFLTACVLPNELGKQETSSLSVFNSSNLLQWGFLLSPASKGERNCLFNS